MNEVNSNAQNPFDLGPKITWLTEKKMKALSKTETHA